MPEFRKLLSGFRLYKATTYSEQKDLVTHMVEQGHKPSTLVIACCDLRVSPDNIFSCNPGDLYIFRNIGALVPPYDVKGANGVIAAIEYAVLSLGVENIVVLGHAHCDGIKLLMDENNKFMKDKSDPMRGWLSIAAKARDAVNKQIPDSKMVEKEKACEQEAILLSIKNLLTYPWIKTRLKKSKIKIYGWHFNIATGQMLAFNPETRFFDPVG